MSMYYDSVTKAVIVPSENSSPQMQPVSETLPRHFEKPRASILENLKKESIHFARVGVAYYKQGLFDEAAESFSEAISKYPTEPLYFGNRALCFLEMGDYERAAADCETALQLGPKCVKFYYRKALALYGLGSTSSSVESLLQAYALALSSASSNPEDYDSLLEEIKEIKERIEFFSQSLSNNDEREFVSQQMTKFEKQFKMNSDASNNRNSTSTDTSNESVFSIRKMEASNDSDPYADPSNPLQAYMLWIGNFSGPNATEKELKKLLRSFGGKTLSCTVFPQTSCALVTLQSAQATGQVMAKLQGYDFYGTSLLVRYKMRAGEKAPILTRESRRRENSWTSRLTTSESNSRGVGFKSDDETEEPTVIADQGQEEKPKAKPLFGQPGESRTVWVGKLSEECSEGDLRKLLSAAGPVCRVNLLSATRCAFVEFGDPDSAEAAVRAFSGRRFFGKIIRLNLACDLVSSSAPKQKLSFSESECCPDSPASNTDLIDQIVPQEMSPMHELINTSLNDSHDGNDEDGRDFKALWLGSLDDPTLSESDILRIFQKYRPISANVITKTSCGFVNFRTESDAAEARRELNGVVIAGNSKRPMRIEFKVIGGFSGSSTKSSPQQIQSPHATEVKPKPNSPVSFGNKLQPGKNSSPGKQ